MLSNMAACGEADVALLQEAGKGPSEDVDVPDGFEFDHVAERLDRRLGPELDRWPAVVKLSDRVRLEWLKQLPVYPARGCPGSNFEMGVSGVGTLATARVTPVEGSAGHSDVPVDTKNVPTYHSVRQSPDTAVYQLDYVLASRGFHRKVRVHAMNGVEEWGPSDHCRVMIDVDVG